jgi:hypothetical protein
MTKTELGYYTVNNQSFGTNKVAAVLEAQKTGADVEWNFHDSVFNAVDWQVEPELSLDQLYKLRAHQIREQYDYVIVFCSGGADSNNVIRTFMDNDIHVDEVVAMIPESGLNNWNWNEKNPSPLNLMSETKYAQYPILNEITVRKPTTKITVLDTFDSMLSNNSDEWIFETEGGMIDMTNFKYGKLDTLPYLVDMAERGVKIAAVWGTDKPIVVFADDGRVGLLLVDNPVYLPKYPFKNVYPNVDRVLFYWSQDMPELLVKQGHVVARELSKPENAKIYKACMDQRTVALTRPAVNSSDDILANIKIIDNDAVNRYSPATVYQRGIVPFIYPSTHNDSLFQVHKFDAVQTFLPAYASWVPTLHNNARVMQMIESDFKLFYSSLSPKYLNSTKTGFNSCFKKYLLGYKINFINK